MLILCSSPPIITCPYIDLDRQTACMYEAQVLILCSSPPAAPRAGAGKRECNAPVRRAAAAGVAQEHHAADGNVTAGCRGAVELASGRVAVTRVRQLYPVVRVAREHHTVDGNIWDAGAEGSDAQEHHTAGENIRDAGAGGSEACRVRERARKLVEALRLVTHVSYI